MQPFSNSKRTTVSIIAIAVWTLWLTILGFQSAFSYLINNWEIASTMVFGSIIAGGTSVGGGAVAFPVFTKLLQMPPYDAKVFSLAIQSVGMGAASLAIFVTKVRVDWKVVLWGSLGGFLGIFIGLQFIAPHLPPDVIKMSFTMMLASFAVALFFANRYVREYNLNVPSWSFKEQGIFIIAGLFGGIMSGLVGNGIDIFSFSVMVLLFGICEKVATPTSVVLMAINAIAGFAIQVFLFNDFSEAVTSYWLAAIPVVVVGAPLGAMLCSLLRRETVTHILMAIIAIEVLTSLILIPLRPVVIYASLTALVLFSFLNYWMHRTGMRRQKSQDIPH